MTTEISHQTRTDIRKGDFAFDELGMEPAATSPERNFTGEALHAFRRRWVTAIVAGVLVGSLASAPVWYLVKNRFTSTAVLRVSMGQSSVLASGGVQDGSNAFDVYKRTQRQLLLNPEVLTAVLQRESVSRLPLVTQQVNSLDWLQKIVSVTFPDEAEIMQVSVRSEDQQTAETLADTIVDVYLQDIVYAERQEKLNRINNLVKAQTATEASLRKKRSDLRQLVDTLGSGDSEALTLAQKNTLQEYTILWTQLNQVQFDLQRARRFQRNPNHAELADLEARAPVSDIELEAAASIDATILGARAEIDRQFAHIEDDHKTMYGATEKEYVAGHQASIERARRRIDGRKTSLRKELAYRKLNSGLAADQLSAASVELLEAQQKELATRVAALRAEADKFGRSSVDAELMRAEIKAMDDLRTRIQRELDEANIEINTLKSRVVKVSGATTLPNDDQKRRLSYVAGSGSAGFFAGCVLIVLWDLRRQRLNSLQEIAKTLRLPVLGTVPRVWGLHGQNRSSEGFEEAINGIVARLVFALPAESRQVILVTSALVGEGKTTLAVNLATSLAAMGRRTVLVDFDLRRPMVHTLFDVDLDPGVGAVLAGQIGTLDAVLSTPIENLFVLPAGAWGQRGLSGRNDELVKSIIGELRGSFDHVVVDAGPVLPIVDTRVVARHADGVVISLLRDVSEIPKVSAACELLRSFDIRILGAVMIGVPTDVYYTATIPKLAESVPDGAV